MAYKRKTIDVWEMYVDYGDGYEYVLAEYSKIEIMRRKREYIENCPQYPIKIIKKREYPNTKETTT